MWKVDPEGVVWEDGCAKPASSNVGDFEPLSIKEIAAKRALTGGPIVAAAGVNPGNVAPGYATQFCDVEVDPETGKVTVLRFVAAQDVGRAIHPSYVEGQIQGGVTQGIGWALNEEYIYDSNGRMENAGFLDYRIPVASDLPMIEPVMVEVPNPDPPLWRQRRRRGQYLPADGGDRQRDRARDRPAVDRVADVAAESTCRDRYAHAGVGLRTQCLRVVPSGVFSLAHIENSCPELICFFQLNSSIHRKNSLFRCVGSFALGLLNYWTNAEL